MTTDDNDSLPHVANSYQHSLPAGTHPFTLRETMAVAAWVSRHRWDSAIQRQRGIKSGIARRSRTASRDEQIGLALESGQSIASIARRFGLARTAIYNVRDRKTSHP